MLYKFRNCSDDGAADEGVAETWLGCEEMEKVKSDCITRLEKLSVVWKKAGWSQTDSLDFLVLSLKRRMSENLKGKVKLVLEVEGAMQRRKPQRVFLKDQW